MYCCSCTTVTLTTMITLPIIIIIIISLFTEITATPYCDQQLKQFRLVTKNLNRRCPLATTNIASCCDLNAYRVPQPTPAVYKINCCWCDAPFEAAKVFCEPCGGWTVIQRRVDGSENFNRPWSDYEKGFGNLNGEFWYGLKAINCLTQAGQWEFRIDFEFENKTRSYLHYNIFKVGTASEKYSLTISGFTGITPTDPLVHHNGMKFSTYDNDNDLSGYNCAAKVDLAEGNGGWWYKDCWNINLNNKYSPEYGSMDLAGTYYNPRWIEMKIRPLNCIPQ